MASFSNHRSAPCFGGPRSRRNSTSHVTALGDDSWLVAANNSFSLEHLMTGVIKRSLCSTTNFNGISWLNLSRLTSSLGKFASRLEDFLMLFALSEGVAAKGTLQKETLQFLRIPACSSLVRVHLYKADTGQAEHLRSALVYVMKLPFVSTFTNEYLSSVFE